MDLHIANPYWYDSPYRRSDFTQESNWLWKRCSFPIETGRWVHAEVPITDIGEISEVYFIFEGWTEGLYEVYIDNFNFEW